jgi:uncharacterized membrane protein (UPF0127 family)
MRKNKRTKRVFWSLFIIVSILVIIGILWNYPMVTNTSSDPSVATNVQIGERLYTAELAVTPQERARGLSGRRDISSSHAMVFVFDEPGLYGFWMNDMNFPIDILWVRNNTVVHVEKNVSHLSPTIVYTPEVEATEVIEVVSGQSEEHGFGVGTKVEYIQD